MRKKLFRRQATSRGGGIGRRRGLKIPRSASPCGFESRPRHLTHVLLAKALYVVGLHASERLQERGIMDWQVVVGLAHGELMLERPDASPNPAVEVRETLPNGTEFKAVWSHLRQSGVAKLVTVHSLTRSHDANSR